MLSWLNKLLYFDEASVYDGGFHVLVCLSTITQRRKTHSPGRAVTWGSYFVLIIWAKIDSLCHYPLKSNPLAPPAIK